MTIYKQLRRNRTRSHRRGGQGLNPSSLGPFARYDVHLGGSSTQLTDSSGNGRAAAPFGATTAAPIYLPYAGVPYVHLEAAGTGTNSVSCTAPAGTASYSAAPLAGGAATTGAAAEGAFAFTTAGDWLTIELLDASEDVLARFVAADSAQTGHTDSFSVAWTINRGTAGRKTVLVNRRSLIQVAANDHVTPPAEAMPPMGKDDGDWTVVVVSRRWATPPSFGGIWSRRGTTVEGDSNVGFYHHHSGTNATDAFFCHDGTTERSMGSAAFTLGQMVVSTFSYVASTTTGSVRINNGAASSGSIAAANDFGPSTVGARIGRTGGFFADAEIAAFLTFNRVLTPAEIALLVTYYGAGA